MIRVDGGPFDGDSDNGVLPAGEDVNKMFDGTTQKYYNPQDFYSGGIITPRANGGNGTTVRGIRFYTGNDAPERDPNYFILEGTNDDPSQGPVVWVPVSQGALALPDGRNPAGSSTTRRRSSTRLSTSPIASVTRPIASASAA